MENPNPHLEAALAQFAGLPGVTRDQAAQLRVTNSGFALNPGSGLTQALPT